MRRQLLSFIVLANLAIQTIANKAQDCYNEGYENCLDIWGKCTNSSGSCVEKCQRSSDCFFDCCYEGYCTFSNGLCTNTNDTNPAIIIAIVIPVVFGVFFIIAIICCCIQRNRRLARMNAMTQQQGAVLNQNAAINNQFNLNQDMMNQNMQMQNMQMTNQQYNNPNYIPMMQPNQPIQQIQPMNPMYYPQQQQVFVQPQQPTIYNVNLPQQGYQQQVIYQQNPQPTNNGIVSYI